VSTDWNLRDIIPVVVPAGYADQLLTIVAAAGCNGFRWKMLDSSSSGIDGGDLAYGDPTG
jgi:hypothetical protein